MPVIGHRQVTPTGVKSGASFDTARKSATAAPAGNPYALAIDSFNGGDIEDTGYMPGPGEAFAATITSTDPTSTELVTLAGIDGATSKAMVDGSVTFYNLYHNTAGAVDITASAPSHDDAVQAITIQATGRALLCDGTDYQSLTGTPFLPGTAVAKAAFTVFCSYYHKTLSSGTIAGVYTGTIGTFSWALILSSSFIRVYVSDGVNTALGIVAVGGAPVDGTWYKIAFEYQPGGDVIKAYANGALALTLDVSTLSSFNADGAAGVDLTLCARNDGANNLANGARIGAFGYWSAAKGEAFLADITDGTKEKFGDLAAGDKTDLELWLSNSKPDGSRFDASGNDRHTTDNNTQLAAADLS